MARKKPGPKPAPEQYRRLVTASTRLTKAEKSYLQRTASKAGTTVCRLLYEGGMQWAREINRSEPAGVGG